MGKSLVDYISNACNATFRRKQAARGETSIASWPRTEGGGLWPPGQNTLPPWRTRKQRTMVSRPEHMRMKQRRNAHNEVKGEKGKCGIKGGRQTVGDRREAGIELGTRRGEELQAEAVLRKKIVGQ